MKRPIIATCIAFVMLIGRSSLANEEPAPVTGAPTPTPATTAAPLQVPSPAKSALAEQLPLSAVMARYTKALGGKELLAKIHSSVSVYASNLAGRTLLTTTTFKAPVYYLQVLQVEGLPAKITVGFDGKTAWMEDAKGEVHALTGADRAEVISDAAGQGGSEIFPERWPTTVSLKPMERIDDRPYVVIAIKAKDGINHDVLLDPDTYRPEMERHMTSKGETSSVVQSFSTGPLGELQWSVATSTGAGSPPITSMLRSVKDNVSVSSSIFSPPLGKGTETI